MPPMVTPCGRLTGCGLGFGVVVVVALVVVSVDVVVLVVVATVVDVDVDVGVVGGGSCADPAGTSASKTPAAESESAATAIPRARFTAQECSARSKICGSFVITPSTPASSIRPSAASSSTVQAKTAAPWA